MNKLDAGCAEDVASMAEACRPQTSGGLCFCGLALACGLCSKVGAGEC